MEFESVQCTIIFTQSVPEITTLFPGLSAKNFFFLMLEEINIACEQTWFAAQLFKTVFTQTIVG